MQESNGIRAEYDYVSALLRVSGYKMPAAAAAIWHGDLREYAYLMTRELYSLSDWAEKYFDLHWFARDLVATGDVVELTNFADVAPTTQCGSPILRQKPRAHGSAQHDEYQPARLGPLAAQQQPSAHVLQRSFTRRRRDVGALGGGRRLAAAR